MKKLVLIVMAIACINAMAASVTVSDPTCASYAITQSGGDVALVCSAAAPAPVPTPTPTPEPIPTPIPPSGLTCDMHLTRGDAASRMVPSGPGIAHALKFVAVGNAHPAVQYNNVSAAVSISAQPCDFSPQQPRCLGVSTVGPGVFTSTYDSRACLLNDGQVYYMNVRMARRDANGNLVEACIDGSSGAFTGAQCEFMPF